MNVDHKQLFANIAGMSSDPDSWLQMFGVLPNPDRVLGKSGKTWDVYQDIDADPHASSVMATRKLMVKSKEWRLVQSDDSAAAIKARDFVADMLAGLGMSRIISDLHRAVFWGFAVSENIWVKDGQRWMVETVKDRPHRRFGFGVDGELRLFTKDQPGEGMVAAPGKFILTQSEATTDNPYGKALLSVIFWPWMFKHSSQKFWMQFLEKYGMPFLVGKYAKNATAEEIQQLLANLQASIRDAVVAMRDDQSAELLVNNSKSSGDAFKSKAEFCNGEISKAILGQNLTTEIKGEASHAASRTHFDVLKMLIDADGVMIAEALYRDLIVPAVGFNFGEHVTPPRFEFYEKDQPNQEWLTAFKSVKDLGVELPVSRMFLYDRLGVPMPGAGDDVVVFGGKRPAKPDKATDFAESGSSAQDAVDGLLDRLLPDAEAALADNEAMIVAAIEASESYEDAMERLLELYPKLDASKLQELLEQGMVNTAFHGASAVAREMGDG